jgi:hypothetical protein
VSTGRAAMEQDRAQQSQPEQPEPFTTELSDEQLDGVAGTGRIESGNNLKQLGLATHISEE